MRRMFVALYALGTLGCGTSKFQQALSMPSIPFTKVHQSVFISADPVVSNTIIRSQEEREAFIRKYPNQVSAVEHFLPKIDFSRHQVILAATRPVSQGDTSLEIVGVEETPQELVVRSVRWVAQPSRNISFNQMPNQPFVAVTISRTDKLVRFEDPIEGSVP